MKQKDYVLIGAVIIMSGIFSYFISNAVFGSPKNRNLKIEVVSPIISDFNKPDSRYFNNSSIDPTQTITIGDNSNEQPFNER